MPSTENFEISHEAGESVSIFVGPNGAGKSVFLRNLACKHKSQRDIVIVCNTPHDRFIGIRGVKRLSVGRIEGHPSAVVKRSVSKALSRSDSKFYQISAVLKYCGYSSRIGFEIESGKSYDRLFEANKVWELSSDPTTRYLGIEPETITKRNESEVARLNAAVAFLKRQNAEEVFWIDPERLLEFNRAREFASVLRLESKLRNSGLLSGIRVYLETINGDRIEIQHASSGQLTLISTLFFLIVNADRDPILIIDEPENSLHPNWQREYISNLLVAMSYRNAEILVATHAPLIVTGALASNPSLVSIYGLKDFESHLLMKGSDGKANSIEEVLWNAFEVVTPANHYVSEKIVDEVNRFESGEITKSDVLTSIKEMELESFDEDQKGFFRAVRKLLDEIEIGQKAAEE